MKIHRVWFKEGVSIGQYEETKSVLIDGNGWSLDWDSKLRELTVVETGSGYTYVVPVENIKLMRKEDAKS